MASNEPDKGDSRPENPSFSRNPISPTLQPENAEAQPGESRSPSGRSPATQGATSYGTINVPASSSRPTSRSTDTPSKQRVTLQDSESSASKAKKPPMTRRASSRHQAPHRGQEFSVDDDAAEIDMDKQKRQTQSKSGPSTVRSQPSTIRRRPTARSPGLTTVNSHEEDEPEPSTSSAGKAKSTEGSKKDVPKASESNSSDDHSDEDEESTSDAESFTLKDRQQAINQTHPFGIRIWKPALYKKNRSVEKTAEGDIHSAPGGYVDKWLRLFNLFWVLFFGWWLAAVAAFGAIICLVLGFAPGTLDYGRVLWGLAGYLFHPFGKFVRLEMDETYIHEDEGEARSLTEYEQWQSGDLENGRLFFGPNSRPTSAKGIVGRRRGSLDSADEADSLLGHSRDGGESTGVDFKAKRRLFGRGDWTVGRIVFFVYFWCLIAPLLMTVSLICWFMVFWIPMGRVTMILFSHLRRHPLALSFHSDASYSRDPSVTSSSVLLCTYRAVGLKYWKYTVDGTNIFLINLIGVVLFTIFDYMVLDEWLGLDIWIVQPGIIFPLALFSVIPLAYFIGQAVASISAQSSMGVGAAINAFFATVVEVFLYCVALDQGKGQLVEGSIIGSIFAGILFLPGISMCFGAINRKTQRFNVQSAGVTSTMLLFAVIAAFGPTLFYQIYGSHELKCSSCITNDSLPSPDSDCRRCFYTQTPAINDRFFVDAVRPYCWFAAIMLFLAYVVGLLFTLRTHAAVIWHNEPEEKRPHQSQISDTSNAPLVSKTSGIIDFANSKTAVRDSQLYKRILSQSLKQIGLPEAGQTGTEPSSIEASTTIESTSQVPVLLPRKLSDEGQGTGTSTPLIEGLSEEQNAHLARQVLEVAATAATVAARDVNRTTRRGHTGSHSTKQDGARATSASASASVGAGEADGIAAADATGQGGGGHDAPNWSKLKSSVILLGATILYAIIAEILVNTVDVVLQNVDIDEKFLGITLFALVPNTTEFLNAISFAMNGNIALSMEIGSAYALQVCLLQIPALVLYSAFTGRFLDADDLYYHSFNLIFPQWDMITVILSVFLLSYVYGEGKSNYFKGSILMMAYLVIVIGFYLSGLSSAMEENGIDRFALAGNLQSKTFKTVGRGRSGIAY